MPGMPLQSYGNVSDIYIHDRLCHCASDAERMWLKHIEPVLIAKEIVWWSWQPEPFPLKYKYGGHDCKYVYRPDAYIKWANGDKWTIEIKRGALHQKAATKMKRFCQQYPNEKLVLVWFGSIPKKGVAHRRLEMLEPWLDHIWRMK